MRAITLGLAVIVLSLSGCGSSQGPSGGFIEPGQSRSSPSGQFLAKIDIVPNDGKPDGLRVIIEDKQGVSVFLDNRTYSARHGVGVTWLSSSDQLWILSSDIGVFSVDRQPDGSWSKSSPRPNHLDEDVPPEIRELVNR